MILEIPMIPVGPNGPKGLFRMHWARRRRYFLDWAWAITVASPHWTYEPPEPPEKAIVRIHQVRGKLMDKDNLYASVKPCMDALVGRKLIKDDKPAHCDLTVTQEVGKQRRTLIEVRPLNETE